MEIRYCLDTSFFINGWRKNYPIDVFPSVWSILDRNIRSGKVVSCDEVYREISHQKDDLFAWVKARKQCFLRVTDELTHQFGEVMHQFPNFAAMGGTTNAADPWVVAQAHLIRATVVSDENSTEQMKKSKPPKIPNVCGALGIKCLKPIDLLRALAVEL